MRRRDTVHSDRTDQSARGVGFLGVTNRMIPWLRWVALVLTLVGGAALVVSMGTIGDASAKEQSRVADPGVRGGSAGAGGPLSGLSGDEQTYFASGAETFAEID